VALRRPRYHGIANQEAFDGKVVDWMEKAATSNFERERLHAAFPKEIQKAQHPNWELWSQLGRGVPSPRSWN
jgi:hypothetical protein